MAIVDEVTTKMKEAMRAKDKPRLQALRNIRASFIDLMKKDNSDTVADDVAISTLRTLAKQRGESITAYREGDRPELAAAEEAELEVINEFLPKLADEATTTGWVEHAIATTGATSRKDMGKVMGMLMKGHRDELDGKLANQIVSRLLED